MIRYRFRDASDVLSYLNSCNPARSKHINLLEAETRTNSDLTASDWAIAFRKTHGVLRTHGGQRQQAFQLRYFGERDKRFHIDEIAELFSRSPRTIQRWISSILDDLDRIYEQVELIPPRDDNRSNQRQAD